MPEIIDPVFAKTSQYAHFLLSENERFGLVFVKTGSINSGTDVYGTEWRERGYGLWKLLCETLARIYRPSFHENKPKPLVFT